MHCLLAFLLALPLTALAQAPLTALAQAPLTALAQAPLTALAQAPLTALAQAPLTADEIMARVAANQDRSEAERVHFLYVQHARVSSRKGKTVRCEEITDVRITPTEAGSHQELLKLDGRLLVKGKYIDYHRPPEGDKRPSEAAKSDDEQITVNVGDEEADRDLVENMRRNLTDRKTKDGLATGLFPLTSKLQAEYRFRLVGREPMNGHPTVHITFEPKDKSNYDWKGDAYIDSEAFEPVLVRTALARNVPFAVRTLLGTSLPGLGFTVVYAPQQGVWFPVSFGTEFKLRVLFFFNRDITLSAANRDFEKTHVASTIVPAAKP